MSGRLHAWMLAAALTVQLAALDDALAEPAAKPAAAKSETAESVLDEVTVTAGRDRLEKRALDFVYHAAAAENGGEGGLLRWKRPAVCPLVSGVSRRDGEFILERLSEIARASGVPLAGESCGPNLYVLVNSHPEALLRAMEKRDRRFTFGADAAPTTVNEFIATPRPVRVWYDVIRWSDDGRVVPPGGSVRTFSKLQFGLEWNIRRVFVVIDETRLKSVSRGQLADYVAMVGFAGISPHLRMGDAPTILKLFDTRSEPPLPSLSDWDRAFLTSLYATDPGSRLQRGQMARTMVHILGR